MLNDYNDNYRVYKPRTIIPDEGLYGLHLMKLVREADMRGAAERRFIDITMPTFEEWKAERWRVSKRKVFKRFAKSPQ